MFQLIQSSTLRAVDSVKLSLYNASIERLYLTQTNDWCVCMYMNDVAVFNNVWLSIVGLDSTRWSWSV